jgi:hypothetical protein
VINYTNVIEKPRGNPGLMMVRVGDQQIVRQFELLCIFGLRAFFDGDRRTVEINCRAKPAQATDLYVPAQYVDRFFDPTLDAQPNDAVRFATFVEKVIGLQRKQYVAVMSALEAFAHSLEVLNYQLDLAYSMLVYSLESLCQAFDDYMPSWEHYEDNVRKQLDSIFSTIDAGAAESIRAVLLKASHLRLRRRFLGFASKYIKPSFFVEEAIGRHHPVKRSQFERGLSNAYDMRSGYVHELVPILKQLSIPQIANGDVFVWEHEPYLTYAGLLRVVYYVISAFIEAQPTVATEELNWTASVPGVVKFQMAPEFWVAAASGFTPAQSRQKFSGTLAIIERGYTNNERIGLNVIPLVNRLESVLGQGTALERSATLALYALLVHFLPHEHRPTNFEKNIKPYAALFNRCNLEMMLLWMITEDLPWPWTADACAAVLDDYMRTKFQKSAISVPNLLEICLYAEVANRFLAARNIAGYEQWLETALFESPGNAVIQEYIISLKPKQVTIDLQEIITLRKGFMPAAVSKSDATSGPIPAPEIIEPTQPVAGASTSPQTADQAKCLETDTSQPSSAQAETTGEKPTPPLQT